MNDGISICRYRGILLPSAASNQRDASQVKNRDITGFQFYITAINSKHQSIFLFSFKVELMLLLAILNGLKSYFMVFSHV